MKKNAGINYKINYIFIRKKYFFLGLFFKLKKYITYFYVYFICFIYKIVHYLFNLIYNKYYFILFYIT